ncbi:hypothetical protein [Nitrososphaera sp.]|uniref:hypothetical protein n=1 Tax=Nitrososphaera sp. TaxID=1971748 RepID=UPI00307FB733
MSQDALVRCNICDENVGMLEVAQHVAGRGHGIKKKVADFQEMNALVRRQYENDQSVVAAWIRNLHGYDFLSSGRT